MTAARAAALGLLALSLLGAAEPGAGAPSRSLADWYAYGGWIMHLLVGCSVLIVAVALERAWNLRRSAVIPRALLARAGEELARGDLDALDERVAPRDSLLARLVHVAVGELRRGAERPEEAVASAGASEVGRLRRNLPLLAALGNIATLLGLLGTVLGMIEAFDTIARVGTSDARIVASGIFRALVTTAGGLSVGIAAMVAHAYFRRRAEGLVLAVEGALGELLERSPGARRGAEAPGRRDASAAEGALRAAEA